MVLTHPKLESIIKLLGTEFIISHTFQCERYFSFACPGSITKVNLLDTVPYITFVQCYMVLQNALCNCKILHCHRNEYDK